jgi:hypothetical protein
MLLFLIAWLLGVGSMHAGFEIEAEVPATCIFALACGVWWLGYKLSRSANGKGMTVGVVALGLWTLNLTVVLFVDFHHTVTNVFFWASTATFLILIAAIARLRLEEQ